MSFFSIKNGKLARIKERNFDYEKDLQKLVEQNLEELFGLEFIHSEFQVRTRPEMYVDTLAFDPQAEAFVIIEYKKDRNFSVIDQGFAYLGSLLANRASAILAYEEKNGVRLKSSAVRWNQTRLIFIAPQFTAHQRQAMSFRDVPFELWQAELFDNNICSFIQVESAETHKSISRVVKSSAVKKVSKEVKTFNLDDHRKRGSTDIRNLFDKLRQKVFDFDDDVKEHPVTNYIGYRRNWFNFVSAHVNKSKLRLYVRMENIDSDPKKRFTKVPLSYGWGKTPLWWLEVSNENELNYAMPGIKESYEKAPDK